MYPLEKAFSKILRVARRQSRAKDMSAVLSDWKSNGISKTSSEPSGIRLT
jgi:hypothetical protein